MKTSDLAWHWEDTWPACCAQRVMLGHVFSQCHARSCVFTVSCCVESYFVKYLIQIYNTVLELTRMKSPNFNRIYFLRGNVNKSYQNLQRNWFLSFVFSKNIFELFIFFHGRESDTGSARFCARGNTCDNAIIPSASFLLCRNPHSKVLFIQCYVS